MREEEKIGKLVNIKIDDIVPFRDHTFKVKDDVDMERLKLSVKENGIMEPIIAFINEDDQVEQVTGHRRIHVCEDLGIETVPVLIKDMTRDEATIVMGETNLQQRTEIAPSEKAKTYKLMLDSLKRQGRTSEAINEDGKTVKIKYSANEELSKKVNDSIRMINRYIHLNNLIPPLLDLVDNKRMAIKPAVEISYLSSALQQAIYKYYRENDVTPSHAQAKTMKDLNKEALLDEKKIEEILSKKKGNQIEDNYKIPKNILNKYFSDCTTQADVERKLCEAMNLLKRQREIEGKNKNYLHEEELGDIGE